VYIREPVVRRKRAVIAPVPRVVQRIAGVALVPVNLQLVIFGFRVNFEMRVLSVSGNERFFRLSEREKAVRGIRK